MTVESVRKYLEHLKFLSESPQPPRQDELPGTVFINPALWSEIREKAKKQLEEYGSKTKDPERLAIWKEVVGEKPKK